MIDLSELFSRLHTMDDHNPTLPHKISFFALLIVTKGTGTHQVDLKEYELEEGSVLKIAKGQIHAFQNNPKYKGFLLIFTEDFVMNYFSKSSINLISHFYNYHITSPISIEKKSNKQLLDQLNTELKSENAFAQNNIIAALLDLYLLQLERTAHSKQRQSNSSINYVRFIEFKNLVESNYTRTRNVKDYANEMLISTKLLNQVVKEFTINTAKNFIDDYVILEAKREIISTHKSLKEIAFQIGFDEVTNFTKFFKKKMNLTPKEFRSKPIT